MACASPNRPCTCADAVRRENRRKKSAAPIMVAASAPAEPGAADSKASGMRCPSAAASRKPHAAASIRSAMRASTPPATQSAKPSATARVTALAKNTSQNTFLPPPCGETNGKHAYYRSGKAEKCKDAPKLSIQLNKFQPKFTLLYPLMSVFRLRIDERPDRDVTKLCADAIPRQIGIFSDFPSNASKILRNHATFSIRDPIYVDTRK